MRIEFTNHYLRRKIERNDYIVPTNSWKETRVNNPTVEAVLRKKGKWFRRFSYDEGLTRVFCIVNNLEVYCGIIIPESNNNIVLITTYYPYSSKMKKKLFPRGKENFEPFDFQPTIKAALP